MTIGALIVLYNPEKGSLMEALHSISPQTDVICLVDNSASTHQQWFDGMPDIHYIPLYTNKGIAGAQNIGIKTLQELGCDYILFSDQDSTASPDIIEKLLHAHRLLADEGIQVATIGTFAQNPNTGYPYPNRSITKRQLNIKGHDLTEVDYVRCSMSLTFVQTLQLVGGMDEVLFIDGVDSEWCWRAFSHHGLRTFILQEAVIYHRLGQDDRKLGTKAITIPATSRLFYQYRNYLWLIRRQYVPKEWKWRNSGKYLLKMFYYPATCKPRKEILMQILRGVKAGFSSPKIGRA